MIIYFIYYIFIEINILLLLFINFFLLLLYYYIILVVVVPSHTINKVAKKNNFNLLI